MMVRGTVMSAPAEHNQGTDDEGQQTSPLKLWAAPAALALVLALIVGGVLLYGDRGDPEEPVYVLSQQDRLQRFTENLHGDDRDRRADAARNLARAGEDGLAVLAEALDSDNIETRRAAASGLIGAGDDGLTVATRLLQAEDPVTAGWGALVLGHICDQRSTEPLAEAAVYWLERYDPNAPPVELGPPYSLSFNPTERPIMDAAKALGYIGSPKAHSVLKTIAAGDAPKAAEAATAAMTMLRKPGDPVPPRPDQIDDATTPELIVALTHARRGPREKAAARLRALEDPGVCPDVRPLLQHDSERVRATAAQLLVDYQDTEAIDRLLEIAREPHAHRMLEALTEFDDPRIVEVITASLESENFAVRHSAVSALMKLQDPTTVPALIAALENDRHGQAVVVAIEALSEIGGEKAIKALEEGAENRPMYSRAIQDALDEARNRKTEQSAE
ncbi:MAG: hypothetical protein GF393_01865 [Armatimonadia bacterium]|nr:hypothetical protein [Armatimonadia bacterium]